MGAATTNNPQQGGVLDPSRDLTFSGGVTFAGGATMPQPQLLFTAVAATATGATGTTATTLPAVTPCVVTVTGVSGAGVALPTGSAVPGSFYVVRNNTTGDLKVYAVGGSINGTTGTTALTISVTGNLGGIIFCPTAGAWFTVGPT